ncbi:MAG: sugar phosphate isomerase/epimerase [Clostridia bacterium]|nr:sugar phosphate isomerase/epimerase [Clostridia bacterium]
MNKNKFRIGLVSISFRKNSPEEILRAAADAGLSCIEWGSDVHAPCTDKERLYEIARLGEKYGIACSSYGSYFRLGVNPIEELQDYIAAARILGTDIIRLWCGNKSGEKFSEEEKERFTDECRLAAEIARREGVVFCMECHRNTYVQHLSDALSIMQAVDSPHFRMYWQPFQWQTVEDNMKYARAIAPYAHHIHVFQWKGSDRFPLSDGIEEWRGYLSNFSIPGALLLEFMPDDEITTLPREADTLRKIIGENI